MTTVSASLNAPAVFTDRIGADWWIGSTPPGNALARARAIAGPLDYPAAFVVIDRRVIQTALNRSRRHRLFRAIGPRRLCYSEKIMVDFPTWCDRTDEAHGVHALQVVTARAADTDFGCDAVAALVPGHYAAEEQVARILRRLGRPKSATFIEGKLPTTKSIRSGDLGEILATEYVASQTPYIVPVKRLRWKDHRNMAMRGDDVIGLRQDPATGRLAFLKGEAKSRVSLAAGVVAEARTGLDKDGGLPSAHALEFISSRLMDGGQEGLADAIDDALLKHGIAPPSVQHLLFTFSGNDPAGYLRPSVQSYAGGYVQRYVGVRIATHGTFVADVYARVIANAHHG